MTIALQQPNTGPVFNGTAGRVRPSIVHCKVDIDGTGSSTAFNIGIHAIVTHLVTELPKMVGKAIFGLHVGRDRDFDADHDINLGDDLTTDEVMNQLPLISYHGGGDDDETQLDSIMQIARATAWAMEANARKVICVFTSSGSKPTVEGLNAQSVGEACGRLGIKVIVIAPVGVNVHDAAAYSGGVSIPLSNSPTPAELQLVCKHLTKTMTQIGNSAGGGTQALHSKFGTNGTVAIGA